MGRILTHLLLMLCLVLNGVGAAAAAASMPAGHGAAPAEARPAQVEGACHAVAVAEAPPEAAPSLGHIPADDGTCCDPGQCDGACAQFTVALPPAFATVGSEDLRAHHRPLAPAVHRDPVLRRAVRPPIRSA